MAKIYSCFNGLTSLSTTISYKFLGGIVDEPFLCHLVFRIEHIRFPLLARQTLPTRVAFPCSASSHDLPTVHRGMGDKAIHVVSVFKIDLHDKVKKG